MSRTNVVVLLSFCPSPSRSLSSRFHSHYWSARAVCTLGSLFGGRCNLCGEFRARPRVQDAERSRPNWTFMDRASARLPLRTAHANRSSDLLHLPDVLHLKTQTPSRILPQPSTQTARAPGRRRAGCGAAPRGFPLFPRFAFLWRPFLLPRLSLFRVLLAHRHIRLARHP